MTWAHGNFYWNELMTHDAEKAKNFYADALGWTFEAMPMPNGTYWMAKSGDKSVAGMFPMAGPDFAGIRKTGCPTWRSITSMPG